MSDKKRQYLSGSQKRKISAKKAKSNEKLLKLENFFTELKSTDETTKSKNLDASVSVIGGTSAIEGASTSATVSTIQSGNVNVVSKIEEDTLIEGTDKFCYTDIDRANFPNVIPESIKLRIINSRYCKPKEPFPKNTSGRSFSLEYFTRKTLTGQKIERFWLRYSKTTNTVYCEPCWLFADRTSPQFVSSSVWCECKINDWQGLSKKILKHENSNIHLTACFTYDIWKNKKTIPLHFSKQNDELKAILKRIFDVIITLARCNLPFRVRGHREEISNINSHSGNFLNIIDLLSRYDPLLKSHLNNERTKNKYLSPKIQNEILTIASAHVLQKITNLISQSPFYSIIVDTTQDIAKIDQLSIIIRYVVVNVGKSVAVAESFIGFYEMSDQSAETFENEILKTLETYNIDLKRCRGQGYDGAANMRGKYRGLQARIKKKYPPLTIFIVLPII